MREAGLDPVALRSAPSVRLAGMGPVDLCVRDEANELNMRDFGLNVAGVLEDSDGWVIESWFGGNRQQLDNPALSSERSYGQAGAQAVYRSNHTALGLDYNWTYFETQDHPGDWSRVRGPLASAIVNRRFGRFILGAVVGSESENESRNSPDFFAIRHNQARWVGQVGGQAAFGATKIGLGWDFERGDVEGKSVDPSRFHEDVLTWVRPVDRFSVSVIHSQGANFEVGVRARLVDRTGGETEVISWSDRSPRNGSKEIFRRSEVVTFSEDESDADVTGRVQLRLARLEIGAEGSYRSWEWDVVEGLNFKGSNREGSRSSDVLRLAAGASTHLLGGRLLAGVQGEVLQDDWETTEGLESSSGTGRYATLGVGAETFVNPEVALRGGAWLTSEDGDIDAPLTLSKGKGFSGGASWLPRGGTVQIHGSLRHTTAEPEKGGATGADEKDETSFLVGLRLLL